MAISPYMGMPPNGQNSPNQPGRPVPSNPIDANRSVFNPRDATMMMQQGQLRPGMKFGEMMESTFGIRWDDPIEAAMGKLGKQVTNANPINKMTNMTGAGPGIQPPGQQRMGQQPPMPTGEPKGLRDLLSETE